LIFSDIHSNLEGLLAVIDDAEGRGYDAAVCLGDFVGYGANPDECVRRVMTLPAVTSVLGNHDAAALDPRQREFFNPVARAAVVYSEQQIGQESRTFLECLPLTARPGNGFLAVHASPHQPEAWIYVLDPHEARIGFNAMADRLAFIGHTHYPVIHRDDGRMMAFPPGEKLRLDDGYRWLINVGSAGQPRDGDPRAAYVIYDADAAEVELFRVDYDIDTAAEKIMAAGLPVMLADRLRRGF